MSTSLPGIFRRGTAGNETLHGSQWNDTLYGADGNDNIHGLLGDDLLAGGNGGDGLDGGHGNDTLSGGGGNDSLHGGDGNDSIVAGSGDDTVGGCLGNDTISAGSGADKVNAGAGDDAVMLGTGNDIAFAGAGADVVEGGSGRDSLAGNDGNDLLRGGDHADRLWGGAGDDLLHGDRGADLLVGGLGADTMNGGTENDFLLSRSDAGEPDIAQGGSRVLADIDLGPADDVLIGGTGADTFRFELEMNARAEIAQRHLRADGTIDWHGVAGENQQPHDHWVDGIGNDVILDFSKAEGDRIQIAGHTVTVSSIDHRDADGDGQDDYSVIQLRSQQGARGAHDEDLLGTITVFGDLVTLADLKVTRPHFGAYETLDGMPYRYEDAGILRGGTFDPLVSASSYDVHGH